MDDDNIDGTNRAEEDGEAEAGGETEAGRFDSEDI
jgi:hypothetical protein